MTQEIKDLKDEEQEKVWRGSVSGWIPGLVLITIGLLFLLNNFFDVGLIENWWALFILIPALVKLNEAWRRYKLAGHWTGAAGSALTGALIVGAVAMIFLFELSWGLFWPVLLIIFGVGILLKQGNSLGEQGITNC